MDPGCGLSLRAESIVEAFRASLQGLRLEITLPDYAISAERQNGKIS